MDGIVDVIKSKLILSDVIKRCGCPLSENGSGYVGWHESKHGSDSKTSLHVDDKKGIWKCFGCGQGGDLLYWFGYERFGASYRNEGDMFFAAMRDAADMAGVEIDTEIDKEAIEGRRNLEDMFHLAAEFYHASLTENHRQLFASRYGFADETIDNLKLGYSTPARDSLIRLFRKEGFTDEQIVSTGLVVQFNSGDMVDLYQGRLIFPYWRGGRVVFFIGRKTEQTPDKKHEDGKYKKQMVHSEKHPYVSEQVSNKYFYYEDAIRGADSVILTEGVADCIIANQTGFPCISPVTVRFQKSDWPHLLDITKHTRTIHIINDNEENNAGTKGALATAEMFWRNGKQVRMVALPRAEGEAKIDLNDYLREHQPEELTALLDKSITLLDLRISEIDGLKEEEYDGKIKEIFSLISYIDDTFVLNRLRSDLPKRIGITKSEYDTLFKATLDRPDKSNSAKSIIDTELPSSWPYEIHHEQLCYLYESEKDEGAIVRKPIARFMAKIVGELVEEDGSIAYTIAGKSLRGGEFQTEMDAEQFSDTRKLKGVIEAAAGPHDPVIVGMEKHLGAAIKMCSPSEVVRSKRYRRTGWLGDRFLIPGREPDDVTLLLPPEIPAMITEDADTDKGVEGLQSLLSLIDSGDASVLLAAVLGPPLSRLAGWANRRYTIFCRGQTGVFKTSTVLAFMSIYGRGYLNEDNLVAWGEKATANAIMKMASHAHDMPFLIDNYKSNTGRGPQAFVSMIHNIMEGSDRKRLDRSANLKESALINCWPICTGEDLPDCDAATLARIIVINFHKRTDPRYPELSKIQSMNGDMPSIGRVWIEWLESEEGRKVAKDVGKELDKARAAWVEKMLALAPDMPNAHRVGTTLAINELTFLAATQHPVLGEILTPYMEAHTRALTAMASIAASYTGESLEANRFLDGLRQLLATGQAILVDPAAVPERIEGRDKERIIGWNESDGSAYVLPSLARSLVKRIIGDDLSSMSNNALYAQLDAIGMIGNKSGDKSTYVKKVNGKSHRVLHLVADAFEATQ